MSGLFRLTKTSFASGEVTPDLLGRGDLRAYANGASTLRNVAVLPTGGVTRRPGLRYLDTVLDVAGGGRLIAFEFSTEQAYLLALTDGRIDVYRDGAWTASIAAPWSADQIGSINWTQSADTLLVTHPDVAPRAITRTSHTEWTVSEWVWAEGGGQIHQPHHRFDPETVTLTPGGTTGTVSLAASSDLFDAGHVGARFRLLGGEVEIAAVASSVAATATV
ncbi:MAG: hypothetical protein OQJ76_03540, partial [Rhodospirillales bacterium]|nr:hypothetical protein [Rhodospirillales bacterium]